MVDEGLLQRVEFPGAEPFDRDDLGLIRLDGKHQARVDGATVDGHCARAALAHATALFRTVKAQGVAQKIQQRGAGTDIQRVAPAVDGNFDWVGVTHVSFHRQVFRRLGAGPALPTP